MIVAVNQTAVDIFLERLGATVPGSGSLDLRIGLTSAEIQADVQLKAEIQNGNILIDPGTGVLTLAESVSYVTTVTVPEEPEATNLTNVSEALGGGAANNTVFVADGAGSGAMVLVDSYVQTTGREVDFEPAWSDLLTSGVSDVSDGKVTISGGLTVALTGGSGWVRRTAPVDTTHVSWVPATLVLAANATSYVVFDGDTLTLLASASPASSSQIPLAKVLTNGASIRYIHDIRVTISQRQSSLDTYLLSTRKFAVISGLAAGYGSTVSRIKVSAGSYFRGMFPITIPGSGGDAVFSSFYGTAGATEVPFQLDLDLTSYDVAGTLTPMTPGAFRSDTLVLTSDNKISLFYGTEEFILEQDALNGGYTHVVPTFLSETGIPLARVIVEQGVGASQYLDVRPVPDAAINGGGGGGGGTSDHSALSNLDVDDHTQYLRTDGTRLLTGNLNLGTNDITNVGLVDGVDVSTLTTNHSSLSNLGSDTHTQYLLADGTRALSGDLNLGTNDITNVGLYNGVDVTDHSALSNLGVDSHTQYLLASGGRTLTGDLNLGTNDITNVGLYNGVDVTDHSALSNLGSDTHTQYLLADGTRALSGNLNLGTNDITNVGLVDGVDVSTLTSNHSALSNLGVDSHTQYLLATGARALTGNLNLGTNDITNVGLVDGVDVSTLTTNHSALSNLGSDTHTQYLLASGARALSGDLNLGTNDITNVGLYNGVDVTDHSALSNLGSDTHTQYLLADGTRALTGDLNLGTNDITNVGLYNGVDVTDHSALSNLGSDTHTQYLLASGTRALSGDLNLGTNDITNVGLYNGVDVTDHSALSNLGSDTHTQYLLATGTRALTGDLNLGTNDITNVGLVDGVDVSTLTTNHSALSNLGVDSHTQYLLASGGRTLTGDLNLGTNDITNVGLYNGVDVTDHSALSNLGSDTHTQYLLADGTRALTGDLNLGTNDITNVGLVDGVDVSTLTSNHSALSNLGVDSHTQYLLASGGRTLTGNLNLGANDITNVGLYNGVDVTDHSALSNLGSDTHTQYLLATGARALTGDLNLGTNDITNVGLVDGVDVSTLTSNHSALSNLGVDSHTQYLLADGTRALSGDLNLGTNDITNVGLYNGVDVTNHSALSNLGSDTHTQYLLASGTRALTGDLNLGTNDITNVGLVDGVDVSTLTANHSALSNLGADDHAQYLRTDGGRTLTGDLNLGTNDLTNVGLYNGVDVTNHSALSNLGSDTHTQYLLASGTRSLTGDLNLGTNDITNVGLVDGVDVTNHSARHAANGLDALSTAAPVGVLVGASPSLGSGPSYARSNHQHGILSATPVALSPDGGNVEGTASTTSRSDHSHNVPAAGPTQGIGGGNAEGGASSFSRSNHDHAIRTTAGPTDLTVGSIEDQQMVQRNGSSLSGNWFGSFLQTANSTGASLSTLTSLSTKLTLVTPSIPAGTYKLEWSYNWNHNNTGNDFVGVIDVDGTPEMRHQQEPKDSAGTSYPPGSGSGTNQSHAASGFIELTFATDATHTMLMQWATSTGGTASTIWNARLLFHRLF